ncbi:hypothetical protein FGADI_12396 [Fusarium gaditjirri]|uniref:Uncharacterized protein n=1 Tax=Fusarium gaditjirri TaxID=282569 RepID=A0A8H4SSQ1_9HYPO|nr:hypothetical protein FGADI_12396 [Fusarium gaditjirri]
MAYLFLLGVILLGLLAIVSQANLLGDAYLLKRYSQVYGVQPAATHFTSNVLSGNSTTTRTSIRGLLPTSTIRMVDATWLSLPLLFDRPVLRPKPTPMLILIMTPQKHSAKQLGASLTPFHLSKALLQRPLSDRATQPTTSEVSLQSTSVTNSDASLAFSEPSETSLTRAESEGLGTAGETGMFPDDELRSASLSSEPVTASNGVSRTSGSSQPAIESGTTELESPTTLIDSAATSQPSTTLKKPGRVTKSDPKSLASEKMSEITKQPITTGGMASSTMTSEDGVVTGTDGTVATYVPEQNKDYISYTGTTTTMEDNGAAIVIFPFGLRFNLRYCQLLKNRPQAPRQRTVSYMTSDGTQVMTEFGNCPKIVSCATESQATSTVTLTSEFIWADVPNTNPIGMIPEDAYTADVDPEIVAALKAEWAEIFGDDDGWNDTETATGTGSTTVDGSTMISLTDTGADSTVTSEGSTTASSNYLTSNTEATATFTTSSDTYSVTTVPSTLITKTRDTSNTTDIPASTDEEATRTYYPCVIHGGPAVESPYCQCSTTITSAPDTGPITDEPIQEPIATTTDGTILVWSAYILDYINIPGITKITQSVGVGEPSTVSTPLPSQTAVDNDGGGQCGTGDGLSKKGLREACDRAINNRSTKGILVAASFGQAACIAKFQCDDYGIGMKGSDIKEAREGAKENDGVDICGHIRLSDSCTIIIDYCTNCETRG